VSQPPVIEALRGATAEAHSRLKTDIDLFGRVADPERRRDLVARFHRLHASVEPAVAPWLAQVPGLAFDRRRRADHIARDLADLGGEPLPLPPVPVGSTAEALGWWYVLEGSSLGGRVVHRTLVGQGKDLQGLSFLHPYGSDTGDWWRRFVEVLDTADRRDPEARPDLLAGGVAGFRHAHEVLCGD
jgi:heme oxygenase